MCFPLGVWGGRRERRLPWVGMSCFPAAHGAFLGSWRNLLHPPAFAEAARPPGARTSQESHLGFTAFPTETGQGQASRAGCCSRPLPRGLPFGAGVPGGLPALGCQEPKGTGTIQHGGEARARRGSTFLPQWVPAGREQGGCLFSPLYCVCRLRLS